MVATPGRRQSALSVVLSTVRYPSSADACIADQVPSVTAPFPELYGGRSRDAARPVMPTIAFWAPWISSYCRQVGAVPRSAWVSVCTPISWPSAVMRRTRSGWSIAAEPTTKNVA